MSCPAATGSAASAGTAVNAPPSSARTSSSNARSRATPTTCAPARLKAMATPRPKPRLAPVTSAVTPSISCPDITLLPVFAVSAPSVWRPTDTDQPEARNSPRAGYALWVAGTRPGAKFPGQAERPEQAGIEEGDDPRDPRRGDVGDRHDVRPIRPVAFALVHRQGGLPVGHGRDQPEPAGRGERTRGEEARHNVPASEPGQHRRHLQGHVLA